MCAVSGQIKGLASGAQVSRSACSKSVPGEGCFRCGASLGWLSAAELAVVLAAIAVRVGAGKGLQGWAKCSLGKGQPVAAVRESW